MFTKNQKSIYALLLITVFTVLGCIEKEELTPDIQIISPNTAINENSIQITNHFENWLDANGYASYDFEGSSGESYGGKSNSSDAVNNQPVIFIHGNSDDAGGWSDSFDYFLSQGYKTSELYAMTWGPASAAQAASQYHSKAYLERVRAFIEAVKSYTGASEVDVIGHSMGVTLGRKAIKGGAAYDAAAGGNYNLGSNLNYIDAFVGIAGANEGLTACYYTGTGVATCSDVNGFYPGYLYWGWGPYNVSDILTDLKNDPTKEADYVYSMWSSVDEVIGGGCYVYGNITCRMPTQDGEKVFYTYPYGHFGLKDHTGYYQLRMVKNHLTY